MFKDGNPFSDKQDAVTYIPIEAQQETSVLVQEVYNDGQQQNESQQDTRFGNPQNPLYEKNFKTENNNFVANPTDMEKTLWSYVQKGNYDKYIDYLIDISVDGESKEQMKSMKTMFSGKIQASMDEKGGLKSFEVKTVSEDETTAELAVSLTYGDGSTDEQTATYKKIDGKWKKD
jgi:hypothetical protein